MGITCLGMLGKNRIGQSDFPMYFRKSCSRQKFRKEDEVSYSMRHFSLFEFENYVSSKIRQRGYQYYRDRRIREMDEMGEGEWFADAHGSDAEPYEVFVQLGGNDGTIVVDYHCSCPYELGLCKHVVAFLYELRELKESEREEDATEQPENVPAQTVEPLSLVQEKVLQANTGEKQLPEQLDTQQSEWLARYELLEPSTRVVWEVLAMYWSPIDIKRLKKVVQALDEEVALRDLNLKRELDLLCRLDLAGTNGMGSYWVEEGPGHVLCEWLFDKDSGLRKAVDAIRRALPEHKGRQKLLHDEEALFREMRFARYLNDARAFLQSVYYLNVEAPHKYSKQIVLSFWLGQQPTIERLEAFPKGIRSALTVLWLELMLDMRMPADQPMLRWVVEHLAQPDIFQASLVTRILKPLLYLFLFTGSFDTLDTFLPVLPAPQRDAFQLLVRTWREGLENVSGVFRKLVGTPFDRMRRNVGEVPFLAHFLAMVVALRDRPNGPLSSFLEKVEWLKDARRKAVFNHPDPVLLTTLAQAILNEKQVAWEQLDIPQDAYVDQLFAQLFKSWCGLPVDVKLIQHLMERFRQLGFRLWEVEAHQLLVHSFTDGAVSSDFYAFKESMGVVTLAEQLRPLTPWERVLKSMEQIVTQSPQSRPQVSSRIAWVLDPEAQTIAPRFQKVSTRTGAWTLGRAVTLEDLTLKYGDVLSPTDWQIVNACKNGTPLLREISLKRCPELLRFLSQHPHVFVEGVSSTPVQFEWVQAILQVIKVEEGYRFRLNPPIAGAGLHLVRQSQTRFAIVEVPPALEEVVALINKKDPLIPFHAEAQLKAVIQRVQSIVPVMTEEDIARLPQVTSDPRIHLHFVPLDQGFELEFLVKPLRDAPPWLPVGQGDVVVVGNIQGKQVRAVRDLEEERQRLQQLMSLPYWSELQLKGHQAIVRDEAHCLQLLNELTSLIKQAVLVVEWPRGGKIHVARQLDLDDFSISIRSVAEWFEIEGQVQIDEAQLLDLLQLLEMMEEHKQFIELQPGEFVALTRRLAKKLEQLQRVAIRGSQRLRLHKLGGLMLDEWRRDLNQVDSDATFNRSIEQARAAFSKQFELPSPSLFQATLRPYQREGYVWLRRLAEWGVGACLADDMGLGKTVQALALMSLRAQQGPQLVVAPASVCRNWLAECQRFCPKLRPHIFAETNRSEVLTRATAGDLIIVTYDLLARESDLFAARRWATIVLDEAQAIKNFQTNRSKAAMRLQGDFKMIMTGTPVENHLGELWNLFHFINPGLLGDRTHFRLQFALPIERGDESARQQLQQLVRPFILRRRKDEVLKDLPEKTEITLEVPLSEEEQAFYEALRVKTLHKLEQASDLSGQMRIQILAALTRLRLAACHPKLVDAQVPIRHSAKLKLFGELVYELVDGGHKALVFSQFVKHLKLLEEVLQQQGISYQYLDGSTPGKVRQQRIEAFQSGQGDVFLISLKAGGTGLNLTAADYVIHMDPWWNPAVEDQATDRAHRIGQERPVTVYRLVAARTIEEKILQLHSEKRDLADALLAGTDASARLSVEDLMQLLRN